MPAIALCLVLFGYIARMARAGMIEALDSDYTRTATLKGLPWRTVIGRHVLRNALLPTITVIATQLGYLIGGLVVVETLFNYQGIGRLILTAATSQDFPMLEAGVLAIGVVYLVATLIADVLYALLNPRIRHAGSDRVSPEPGAADADDARGAAERPLGRAAGDRCARCSGRRRFLVGVDHRRLLGGLRDLRARLAPGPATRPAWTCSSRRRSEHWFGTDQLGRDVFARVIVGARDILIVAPLATLLGTVLGTALGLVMGYFARAGRRHPGADRRGRPGAAGGHRRAARGRRARPVDEHGDRRHRPRLHAADRAHGARRGAVGARARLRRPPPSCAASGAPYIMFVEILPNVLPPILVEFTVRLGYAIFTVATLSFLGFGIQPPSPDWGLQISEDYTSCRPATGGRRCSRRWRSPRW